MPKPELGTVKVGDTLYVTEPNCRRPEPIEVIVTKVGRVWIEMSRPEYANFSWPGYRMRLDTQTTGSSTGSPTYFLTPDQLAWQERERAAVAYLKEQGLHHWELDTRGGPWRGRLLELANVIRTHEGLPEL